LQSFHFPLVAAAERHFTGCVIPSTLRNGDRFRQRRPFPRMLGRDKN
jgi:hypothetical protein